MNRRTFFAAVAGALVATQVPVASELAPFEAKVRRMFAHRRPDPAAWRTWYVQVLHRYNESIAADYMLPFRVRR